jgi:hypothetical protein
MEVENARLETEKVKLEKDSQSVSQVFECPDAKYQSIVDKKFLEKRSNTGPLYFYERKLNENLSRQWSIYAYKRSSDGRGA